MLRTVVCVDGLNVGYTSFYRTMNKMGIPRKPSIIYNNKWIEDNEFMNLFKIDIIESIIKDVNLSNTCYFIAIDDDNPVNYWRKDVYKGYKGKKRRNRSTMVPAFTCAFDYVASELCTQIIKIPHAEADDIIGVITRKLISNDIVIVSTDSDFNQLRNDNVDIKSPDSIDRSNKFTVPSNMNIERFAVNQLWKKIIVGDPTDKIPGAIPGVGKIKAASLITELTRHSIETIVNEHYGDRRDIVNAIKRNRKLIDLQYTPKYIEKSTMEFIKNRA